METSQGQPIPFIEISERDEDNKTSLMVNPYAVSLLQEMKDKKVAVLVVAGPPITGKSFLANRILDTEEGFALGTHNTPGTEGIWLWSEPIKFNEEDEFETLVLDMQGVNLTTGDDPNTEDQNSTKAKLLTLSLLLSSMFLYNSIGPVAEKSFEDLAIMKEVQKFIDSREAEDKQPSTDYSSFLPFFIWVLRDFGLNLNGKAPNEYLTNCLNPVENSTPEDEALNTVRTTLSTYFNERECHCLVKPLNDENQLKEISQVPVKKMKPLFMYSVQGVNALKEKIVAYLKPKSVKGRTLTGSMLMNLTFEFVETLNNDKPASIFISTENVISSETRKMYENTLVEYYDAADEEFNENKMPLEDEQMNETFKRTLKEIIRKFEGGTKDFADLNQLLEFRNSILDEIENDFSQRLQKNDEISQHLCKVLINEFFNSFDLASLLDEKEIKESTMHEYKEKFLAFYENYKIFAKGAHKFNILADCLPNFLFEFFEKYLESINKTYQRQVGDYKMDSSESKATEDNLRKRLAEAEDQTIELQKDRDEIMRQYKKHLRENTLQLALKEDEEQSRLAEINSLKEKLYKKKEKSRELKRKAKELEDSLEKDKQEKDILKKQQLFMKDEVKSLEDKVRESYSLRNSNPSNELSPQLPGMMKNLFKQIDSLKSAITPSDAMRSSDIKSELEKQEEIAIVKQAFEKKLNENWERLKQMKEEYQRDNEKLRKQLEEQRNENAQLRVQNIENTKNIENLHKKDQFIQKLKKELETMTQQLDLKKNDHRVSVEVTEKFKEVVEETNIKVQDQEGKIAELKSEVNKLKSMHFDIIYACKEAVKKILKRPHYLKNAIDALDEEMADEIRGIFQELGIKLDY